MKNIIFFFISILLFYSCGHKEEILFTIDVKNTLNLNRAFETVEIDISSITENKHLNLVVLDSESNSLTSQLVDTNLDGKHDLLLFQPVIKANSTQTYKLAITDKKQDTATAHCYARFVPERTDDYAWENNKVAFRTYGPVAQQMVENGDKGGTLSSGIDAWLKRVNYPIINKWYKKHTSGKGSYHKDTGEGLDNFHVGVSRGVGGTAVKVDSLYYFSNNFTTYKTITTGPIRASFVLSYPRWSANGKQITETKHISLDYGQQLTRFKIDVQGTNVISTGLTLHNNKGIANSNKAFSWVSYWEALDDSEIGTGIVTTPTYFIGTDKYISSKKDQSNQYLQLKVVDGSVVFYSGFGWKKAKEFTNKKAWENYLTAFSKTLKTPLIVTQY